MKRNNLENYNSSKVEDLVAPPISELPYRNPKINYDNEFSDEV